MVRLNIADLGIMPRCRPPSKVSYIPWKTYAAYLVLPLHHPLLENAHLDYSEILTEQVLNHYPLVEVLMTGQAHNRVEETLRNLNLPYNVVVEVESVEAAKMFVANGWGPAVLSGVCLTQGDLSKLATIAIPQKYGGDTTYGLILQQDKLLRPPLKSLLNLFNCRM